MLINEVESKTGLSKKSIRYYEKEGLLNPVRNSENGYRTYTEQDIKFLKKIKFLRELGISIQELKNLCKGEISLKECMLERVKQQEIYEKNYQKVKLMCNEIYSSEIGVVDLDVEEYSKKLNLLKKEGFVVNDLNKDREKKIWGAVISSVIFLLLFLFLAGLITYFQMTEEEKMPMVLYVFFMGVFVVPMISVIMNLNIRIKEINGGEEDEASKY